MWVKQTYLLTLKLRPSCTPSFCKIRTMSIICFLARRIRGLTHQNVLVDSSLLFQKPPRVDSKGNAMSRKCKCTDVIVRQIAPISPYPDTFAGAYHAWPGMLCSPCREQRLRWAVPSGTPSAATMSCSEARRASSEACASSTQMARSSFMRDQEALRVS